MASPGWITRYLAGSHELVWEETVGCGQGVRDDAALLGEAEAVARETMRRVRRNAERLERTLRDLGSEFQAEKPGVAWPPEVLAPVDFDAAAKLERIECRIGPTPVSVKAFFLEVGGIAFNGCLPGWPVRYADPFGGLHEP